MSTKAIGQVQTITSMEVAEMTEREHSKLLRDIRKYEEYLGEAKIGFTDFWMASTYKTSQNKVQPCYLVTKKGCEFIAHKMTGQKRTADKLIAIIREWLQTHSLDLKGNWQKFRTAKRMPNALGYRFGKDYILIRKKNRLRLKQQLKRYYRMRERGEFITCKFAQGLLSRLGMLRHCNSVSFYEQYVKRKTQKHLKDIVRDYYRKEMLKWNTSMEPQKKMA